jgi:hypothetical protein
MAPIFERMCKSASTIPRKVINQAHLRRVMGEYIAFFNTARPHQGIAQQIPIPPAMQATSGPVCYRNVLGGVIHDSIALLPSRKLGCLRGFLGLPVGQQIPAFLDQTSAFESLGQPVVI